MVKIKICGIRRIEDIEAVNKYKPDYIGMILAKGYKRTVEPETAEKICRNLDKNIKKVGVFVNTPLEDVRKCIKFIGLDAVQLHGDEDENYIQELNAPCEVWKAIRVRGGMDIPEIKYADRILLDKYDANTAGGTGETFDSSELGKIRTKQPIILAGGLNTENVIERINQFKPKCVDVSSAVETDGFKDENKIREFIEKVRTI